jgi:hypothetical protein
MIQAFVQRCQAGSSRRASALLLAVLLNLALVPCGMALEVAEEGHDCCPPELNLEPQECCVLDDVGTDSRAGSLKQDSSSDCDELASAPSVIAETSASRHTIAVVDPPDPPRPATALHKLHCVYLI